MQSIILIFYVKGNWNHVQSLSQQAQWLFAMKDISALLYGKEEKTSLKSVAIKNSYLFAFM